MAIDANVLIDGKSRGRYDFPEKTPKKLSDLENDLFYVRKKYIFDLTRNAIENYPLLYHEVGLGNIRKYSDNTQISYELYYRLDNAEEEDANKHGLVVTLSSGLITVLGGLY